MQSRNSNENLQFGINFNFASDNLFSLYDTSYFNPPPPVTGFFLLLDGTNFLLLDGTNFLVLG